MGEARDTSAEFGGPHFRGVAAGLPVFADIMTTSQMAEHQRRGSIVLLPLGCFEMHGVQASMSTDTWLAEAACRVLAEAWEDVLIYPPVHYCYPGASGPWAGSVSVSPLETIQYVIGVVRAIIKNGFKRVVLVSLHGPNGFLLQVALRTLFEETGDLPVHFSPDYGEFCRRVESVFGQPHAEAAMLLASLYMVGRHGEFDPSVGGTEVVPGPAYPFESAGRLRQCGVSFPYYFVEPNNHVGYYPGLKLDDAPKLAEIYREVILEKGRDLPVAYAQFQAEMQEAMASAPWDVDRA